jgi:hypothetical protein
MRWRLLSLTAGLRSQATTSNVLVAGGSSMEFFLRLIVPIALAGVILLFVLALWKSGYGDGDDN